MAKYRTCIRCGGRRPYRGKTKLCLSCSSKHNGRKVKMFNAICKFFKKEKETSLEDFKKLNAKDRKTKIYQELLVICGN